MARFVVLVIDSFGVGAMTDVTLVRPQDAGANTCGHILSQLPHLQLPTLEKLGLINALGYAPGDMQPSDSATWGVAENAGETGANQRIGLCARRYAAVRFRNLGRGRAAT